MNLLKNKRGEGELQAMDSVLGIPVTFILLLGIFTLLFFMGGLNISTAQVPKNLQLDMIVNRFIMSPYCFAYTDSSTGRTYPGKISLTQNPDPVACFNTAGAAKDNPDAKANIPYAFKIIVYKSDRPDGFGGAADKKLGEYTTDNWDDDIQPISDFDREVIIVSNDKESSGIMTIIVQQAHISTE